MDTIWNIVSRRPKFIRTLIQEDAVAALATLTMGALSPDKGSSRIPEDYKREAIKRAKNLSSHIEQFNEWTPDALPVLEPVSMAHTFTFFVDQ